MTTEALTAIKATLEHRIDEYFDLAFDEGVEGRSCDTPDGRAQECRNQIDQSISSLISSYEAMENELDSFRSSFRGQMGWKARIAELEEALTPFAAVDVGDLYDDADEIAWPFFYARQYRAAAAALTPTVEKVETPAQAPAPSTHLILPTMEEYDRALAYAEGHATSPDERKNLTLVGLTAAMITRSRATKPAPQTRVEATSE